MVEWANRARWYNCQNITGFSPEILRGGKSLVCVCMQVQAYYSLVVTIVVYL